MGKYLDGSTRQLTDLRVRPSVAVINGVNVADDRPHFDLGELPVQHPDYGKVPPFRALRWHPVTGAEVCATSLEQLQRYDAEGYSAYPPLRAPKSSVEDVADELAGLTDEERQIVLEAHRKARLDSIQAKLSKLSDAELASVTGGKRAKRKTDA
jgi:hypothetical protein